VARPKWKPSYNFALAAGVVGIGALARWLFNVPEIEAILFLLAGFLIVAAAITPLVPKALQGMHERHQTQIQAEIRSITDAVHAIDNGALKKLILFNYRLMERFVDVALDQA
jgi:hypothetical protein